MEQPTDFTHKRESTATPYSELGMEAGTEKLSKDKWGVAEYKGELILYYIDPELIKDVFTTRIVQNLSDRGITSEQTVNIADFGGGDGVLLDTVTKQIVDAGYGKVLGVNIDFEKKWLDLMQKKFVAENDVSDRKIYGIQGDLTDIPLQEGTIDAGYSRFALQYISKENQTIAIKGMLATLKPGAELVIQWPNASETEEQSAFLDEFDANIDSIITGIPLEDVRGNRHFASLAELKKIAEDLGAYHEVKILEDFKVLISSEIYADRFNVKDESKLKKLQDLFKDPHFRNKARDLGVLNFIDEDGKTYVEYKIGIAVLKP